LKCVDWLINQSEHVAIRKKYFKDQERQNRRLRLLLARNLKSEKNYHILFEKHLS
jgi:hypothetical protein